MIDRVSLGPPKDENPARKPPTTAFPAKAGTQALLLKRKTVLRPTVCARNPKRRASNRPFCRVIARRIAAKQSRATTIQVLVSPLGCFAALAMTRGGGDPLPRLRRYLPQRGKILL